MIIETTSLVKIGRSGEVGASDTNSNTQRISTFTVEIDQGFV